MNATAALSVLDDTQSTPRISRHSQSDTEWTPGFSAGRDFQDSESESECPARPKSRVLDLFNSSMSNLAEIAGKQSIDPLKSQLEHWEDCSEMEKQTYARTAKEACQLVCHVIAPRDGEKLFQVVQQQQNGGIARDTGLEALIAAYKKAPSKALKTQILSIYANRFTATELKAIHRPFENLSDRQIKKARAHSSSKGSGNPLTKIPQHRIRLEKGKLDHFMEFTSRPYFYQDVAFGSRKLKLESGEEMVMPNIVRTVARCTIINQYLDFCKEENFTPLSRATMWRILEVQEASQRKSLKGLDNTAADGAEGFEALYEIVDQLEEVGADKEWSSQTRKRLKDSKLYLKTTYRDHCQEESACPDHCRVFALSDADDADYQTLCNHEHDHACRDCDSLKEVIQEIQCSISEYSSKINDKEKEDDLRYEADIAEVKIKEWKAHIMRAQNQEQSKQNILLSLQENEVFIILDWAMKFTQMKFREKQSEWFGKRGINWHICCVISRKEDKLEVTSYAHLFNSCTQDWFSVLSIIENLMAIIKTSDPGITKAYLRSDEAGCYHNSSLTASLRDIGDRQGIEIVRYDHSEPQHGKDLCDRILCPMKAAIRRYCNEGHDIVTAHDMQVALDKRPVQGTTAAVFCVNEEKKTLKMKKIANYSSLHNFEFTPDGLRVWKAYNIGTGKLISWESIILYPQEATSLVEEKPFFPTSTREMYRKTNQQKKDAEDEDSIECPNPQCMAEFHSRSELEAHLNVIGHHSPAEQVRRGLYDTLRIDWVRRFQNISLDGKRKTRHESEVESATATEDGLLKMGWALHKPRGGQTRFSPKVRAYLQKKFEIGLGRGRKEEPSQVANHMRKARNADGTRMFGRTEWLSKLQIQGFFSRMSAKRKQSTLKEFSTDEEDDEIDDGAAEEYACQNDEQLEKETSEAVVEAIGVRHPLMYDVFNLCEMANENKLSSFKCKMLKEICQHFEIPFNTRNSKSQLLQKITEMVAECSCSSK